MKIPTEPIGSIPRPDYLIKAIAGYADGTISETEFQKLAGKAVKETVELFIATGSPVITDGEQTKPSFVTYPIYGSSDLSPDGVTIPFKDGHTRRLPTISKGPFHYQGYASQYLRAAKHLTNLPIKQAVISASAMSLLYPQEPLNGYSRDNFIEDVVDEAERDIRNCFHAGAYNVQIDFTEARLAIKLDPSKTLLRAFIELNNKVLERFTDGERTRIGVHTCPGGDHDSTHSADIDYADLLPDFFRLNAGNFYLEYAAETNKRDVLKAIKASMRPGQRVFLGVTDVLNPKVESPKEVCDLIIEASEFIPVSSLGTCDDCGFSPFADDISTSRDIAFAKIKARVEGTEMAERKLT